jgi:hypothetical protein
MFKSILRRKKPSSTETTIINPDRATFFALPAELRLEIYHLATQDFTLTLRSDLDKNPRKNSLKPDNYTTHPRPIPSLLLVSRQCRNETLPILLSTATIKIRVSDFDFKDLVRVEGSLYATELKALRRNENVWILMRFPGQGVMRSEERVRFVLSCSYRNTFADEGYCDLDDGLRTAPRDLVASLGATV